MAISRKDTQKKTPPPAPPRRNGKDHHAPETREEFPLVTVMRDDGSVDDAAMPKLSREEIERLYRLMLQNRILDERLTTLQRQGRIGFHIGSIGEEAAIIGSSFACLPSDWIFPCYREAGAALLRGMTMQTFLHNMYGTSLDPVKGRQMPCHWYDREHNMPSVSSPIGTQITHAVGAARAARIKGDNTVTRVNFGEGATSSHEFHVGANFAGVFKAPCVLFCRNNQWAISVPFNRQTGSENIAVKSLAYGIRGVRVDGNDLFAVVKATRDAVEHARKGGGATLLEAVSYRVGGHSTSDDPRVYRKESEVEPWMKKDPIDRMRRFLRKQGWLDEKADEALAKSIHEEITAGIAVAESTQPPSIESMFEDVYKEVPPWLEAQKQECLAAPRWKGH